MWETASTTDLFLLVSNDVRIVLTQVLLGLITTIIALMGLYFGITRTKKYLLGRQF